MFYVQYLSILDNCDIYFYHHGFQIMSLKFTSSKFRFKISMRNYEIEQNGTKLLFTIAWYDILLHTIKYHLVPENTERFYKILLILKISLNIC
jgi:hypothetical protein